MLDFWSSQEGNSAGDMRVDDTGKDTNTLALHIICGAGFGVPQVWPHEDEAVLGNEKSGFNTKNLVGGHTVTFKDALKRTIGVEISALGILPHWILSKFVKNTYLAFSEWLMNYRVFSTSNKQFLNGGV